MTDKIFDSRLVPAAKILVIDDSHLNRCFIENAFSEPDYIIISACDAKQGIELAKLEQPELILMDVMMPLINGFTATEMLKADPEVSDIPVIFITALDAVSDKLRAFEVGAVDFVTKPFNHKELIARVYTNIALRRVNAEREQMLKAAMEGKRNESIAKIAAGVSHNFNNMLTVTIGNLMLIESMISKHFDEEAKDAFDDVMTSIKRMQDMSKQFLVLANRKSEVDGGVPMPDNFDLGLLVDKSLNDEIKEMVINNIQPGVKVYVDKNHILENFTLIFTEIFEITAGAAKCEVCLREVESNSDVMCEINVEELEVHHELHDTIFEPFALPIANVGTGLSLAVAKHILELNHCQLKAEFPAKNRVTFVLTFPKAR